MDLKYRFRLFLLTALVLGGCGTLLSRLYEFQIERRPEFLANVPTNHNVTIREPGVRGEITDRNGIVLARNRRSYEIVFNLAEIYRGYLEHLRALEQEATPIVRIETEATPDGPADKADVITAVHKWVIPKLESYGLTGKRFTNGISEHFATHGGLVPFVYRSDLTPAQFSKIAVHSHELPGVEVRVMPQRIYPYGALAGHLLGYVKEWAKGDVPDEWKQDSRMHYSGDVEGVSGVEFTTDQHLKGKPGKRVLVRNQYNKVIATDDYTRAQEGAQVQLTIDAHIQAICENALRKIGRGAAVVMDPNTGEVLAMASVPNLDPNDFIPGISAERFANYNTNRARPFTNRAISGFIPGSTFKLPTAVAATIHGKVGHTHDCQGFSEFGKTKIRCWKTSGHGLLGLSEAIKRSCNPYFMSLAGDLRSTAMVDTFELLGLGQKSGIFLPNEAKGLVPGSQDWRRRYAGASMTLASLAQLSIGQSQSIATPLQICSVAATLANGGRYYQPRIVRRIVQKSPSGAPEILRENIPIVKADLLREGITAGQIEIIRKGMWKAVNEVGGTANKAALKDIFIAAKTGTAQVSKTNPNHTHNAWTVSFAPYDSPRYAMCVLVENGTSGGAVAGVLSRLIYRDIFDLEAGESQHLEKQPRYAGNFLSFDKIDLPLAEAFSLNSEDIGETGNEIEAAIAPEEEPIRVTPTLPSPTIAPRPDQ